MTGSLQLVPLLRRYGTFLGFLLIVSFFWTQRPDTFMTTRNWLNITQQVSILCDFLHDDPRDGRRRF